MKLKGPQTRVKRIAKAPTGIRGLDEITAGGLPAGRPTLICGGPGCGKTLLAMEFIARGIEQYGEPGVFMAFEEREKELAENVASLGFDLPRLVARKKLVVDHVRVERSEIEETGEYDLEGLFIRLGHAIKSVGAKRVVLDTVEALFAGIPNEGIVRAELRRLFGWLKDKGVTAIITGERGASSLTRHGLEEYVSDCVIFLDHRVLDETCTRRLRVVKYRGSTHGTNEYPFLIDASGITVMPVTSLRLEHGVSSARISSGIPRLDFMLGGQGYYRGSSVLLSGTAGTGKTSVAASFADAVCLVATNLADERGRELGLLGMMEDVKRAKLAVEAERRRFFDVLETLPAMICLLTPDYHVAFANRAFRDRFGETQGRHCYEACFGRTTPCDFCEAFKVLETGTLHRWELNLPDGSLLEIFNLPFTDENGARIVLEMELDITEQRGNQEKLHQTYAYNRSLIEASLDPLVTIGPDGKITDVNVATEQATGCTRTELIGTDFSDYFTEPEKARAGYQQVFREGAVRDYPLGLRHRNGAVASVLYNASVYRDELGKVIGVFAAARDVTERKKAEAEIRNLNAGLEQRVLERTKALAESEERFRTIYDTAPVSIWQEDWTDVIAMIRPLRKEGITDFAAWFREHPEFVARALAAVKILDINQWTVGMFKARDKAEILASLGIVFATPSTLEGFIGELVALAQGRAVFRTEMDVNTVDGGQICGLLAMSFPPPESDSGSVLVSVVDITARKQAEEQIQKLNEELRRRAAELETSNKELESFSYSVSHDLRTPLRSIDGFSRLLLEQQSEKLDAKGQDHLKRIRAATQRMGHLIDDLLMLAAVTRRDFRLHRVNLSLLAHGIVEELQKEHPERRVEWRITPGMWARGDAHLLTIMLENLLRNAWKFTGRQAAPIIEFGTTQRNGIPMFFVRDNGAGFDMAYASKLFGPFQRLHSAVDFPGTGIGLALVQRVIQRHGGIIEAEAQVRQGAAFYFTLPTEETKSS